MRKTLEQRLAAFRSQRNPLVEGRIEARSRTVDAERTGVRSLMGPGAVAFDLRAATQEVRALRGDIEFFDKAIEGLDEQIRTTLGELAQLDRDEQAATVFAASIRADGELRDSAKVLTRTLREATQSVVAALGRRRSAIADARAARARCVELGVMVDGTPADLSLFENAIAANLALSIEAQARADWFVAGPPMEVGG